MATLIRRICTQAHVHSMWIAFHSVVGHMVDHITLIALSINSSAPCTSSHAPFTTKHLLHTYTCNGADTLNAPQPCIPLLHLASIGPAYIATIFMTFTTFLQSCSALKLWSGGVTGQSSVDLTRLPHKWQNFTTQPVLIDIYAIAVAVAL